MPKTYQGLPKWIVVWLSISMLFILWDGLYIMLRPASFAGGSLAAIWIPYIKYITIDKSYADLHNDFVNTIPIMNLLEIGLGLFALYFNYIRKISLAVLFAFSSLLLTGTKTILVFVIESVGGFKHVGHNPISDLVLYYILPNSLWIIIPFIAVLTLGRYLISQMDEKSSACR